MLDGELDAASIRRVMVHADVCPSCRSFLKSIRDSVQAHRDLAATGMLSDQLPSTAQARELRSRLIENQRQLARILYELGRGFVLMTVSKNFSRVVAREPVPPPDMCLRGRSLLDEVQRVSAAGRFDAGEEWVRAKVLFDNAYPRSPEEFLARGQRMLREALALRTDYHEARIYLGQALQVEQDLDGAAAEYRQVMEQAADPVMRAFALENLGNVFLERGDAAAAAPLFRELIESGVLAREPRFFTAYFNLGLAHGLCGEVDESRTWWRRLHQEFPHKRRYISAELRRRPVLLTTLRQCPENWSQLKDEFPDWFADG